MSGWPESRSIHAPKSAGSRRNREDETHQAVDIGDTKIAAGIVRDDLLACERIDATGTIREHLELNLFISLSVRVEKMISGTEQSGRSVTWNFDGIYRLTSETISSDPSNENGSVAYGLDPVGNRLSANSTLSGVNSGSFSFNGDDLMGGESYDANGNTTATGGKTFAYDSDNRLKSMNGGAVTIVYDGDGSRVAKTVNGATTRYLVDDLNPTGYAQVVEESVNGSVQRAYSYGLQRIDVIQLVNSTWTLSFYGHDGSGSVRQLTTAAGAVTDTYEYDAFGNLLNKTGTTPNNYLYRGEQYDPDLGLYYLRARYYNPLTGRFMSRDPEDGIPTDPMTLHKYAYADGDPVNATDPTGRSAVAEDVEVTVKIDLGALPAVAALGCAVNLAYNVIALKVVNDFDITPTAKCGAKGKGRMRIQLQSGTTVTIPGTPVLVRDDPPGVTKADAYAGLMQLWGLAQGGQSGFPFNANQSDLRSAIISVSECVKRQSGTAPGIYAVCQAYVTGNTAGWRIDLENLNGINLRQ
jgi:RHS repeat-associated protein